MTEGAGRIRDRVPVEDAGVEAGEDLDLFDGVRVGQQVLDHETVELGFGQLIGAFLLDRVLGGHDEEGAGEFEAVAADGRLLLLHGLEHRRLGLRRGPVDLIEEDDIGVHRSEDGVERPLTRVVDLGTDDVGRQQIGGALDAGELPVDGIGQGRGGRRLRQTRDALEQQVSAGQQTDEQRFAQTLLTDDEMVEVGLKTVEDRLRVGDLLGVGRCRCRHSRQPLGSSRCGLQHIGWH